jgi:uncharacterized protein
MEQVAMQHIPPTDQPLVSAPEGGLSPRLVAPRELREAGLDIARALAVLGMMLVNFDAVLVPHHGASHHAHEGIAAELIAAISGRAAALFAILAGVGLGLIARGGQLDERGRARVRTKLWARSVVLAFCGALLLVVWPADILHFYALYIAIAAAVLWVGDRWLAWLVTLLAVGFVPLSLLWDYDTSWEAMHLVHPLLAPSSLAERFLFSGYHPLFPWLGFVLLGVLLVRRRRLWQAGTLRWSAALAIGSELFAASLQHAPLPERAAILFDRFPLPPTPLFALSAGATGVALVAIMIRVAPRLPTKGAALLSATGRMSLTLYVSHALVLAIAAGLGAGGALSPAVALLFALLSFALGTLFASGWLAHRAQGPLEAVLRWATQQIERANGQIRIRTIKLLNLER